MEHTGYDRANVLTELSRYRGRAMGACCPDPFPYVMLSVVGATPPRPYVAEHEQAVGVPVTDPKG